MRNVIVTGSGRSGTSMVAGTLAGAGYWMGGDLVEPRDSNPKGFFESRRINAINEALLAESIRRQGVPVNPTLGRRHYWLASLPLEVEVASDGPTGRQLARACARQPFCYKDPRFCYTLEAWRPYLPDQTVMVCVFRDPGRTAASICREVATAGYLAGVSMDYEQAVGLWCAMYRWVLERQSRWGRWLFIHAEQLFEPAGQKRLSDWTGAPVDGRFPERGLQRSRSDRPVGAEAEGIYRRLCRLAGYVPPGRSGLARPGQDSTM